MKKLFFLLIGTVLLLGVSCSKDDAPSFRFSDATLTIIPDYDDGGILYAYNYDEEKKTSTFSFDVKVFPEKYLDVFTSSFRNVKCGISFCNVFAKSGSNEGNFRIDEVEIAQASSGDSRFLHVTTSLNDEQLTAICLLDYRVSFEVSSWNGEEGTATQYVPLVIGLDPDIYETKDALEYISDEDLAALLGYEDLMQAILDYWSKYLEGPEVSEYVGPELDEMFNLFSSDTKAQAKWSGDSWMSNVSDDKLVCKMSIPGSHDTCTENVNGIVRAFAETQWFTIENQFKRGCRCFDLRPGVDSSDKELKIWHGPASCRRTFMEAVDLILGQLNAHPSEFAIVIVNQERDDEYTKYRTSWEEDEVWRRHPGRFVNFRGDLRVRDLRGKILFINRDSFYTGSKYSRNGIYPVGGFTSGWGSGEGYLYSIDIKTPKKQDGNTKMYVQDIEESYDANEINKKKAEIKKLLDKFADVPEDELVWCFNHASGYYNEGRRSATICNYPKHAQYVNGEIADYIKNKIAGRPTGIIMMDYAGDDTRKRYTTRYYVNGDKLMNAVIDNNFR